MYSPLKCNNTMTSPQCSPHLTYLFPGGDLGCSCFSDDNVGPINHSLIDGAMYGDQNKPPYVKFHLVLAEIEPSPLGVLES